MPVTIRDVARHAGVSTSAVSLVMRDAPGVSEETRARVRAVAEKLGYRRHAAFAALGSRRKPRDPASTVRVALVTAQRLSSSRLPAFLRGRLEPLGFTLDVLDWHRLEANPPRVLRARGYSVALLHYVPDEASDAGLDWRDLVVLAVGRLGAALPFHTLRFAHTQGAREAFVRAHSAGYRRIAFAPIGHAPAIQDDRERLEGLLAAYYELTGTFPQIPPLLSPALVSREVGSWAAHHRPDCVIGFNRATYTGLQTASLRIPEDVAFVSLASTGPGDMAGMVESWDTLAQVAADFIDHYFRNSVFGLPPHPHETLLPLEWRDGFTLPVSRASQHLRGHPEGRR